MDNFQYCCGGLDVPYLWLGVTICNQQEADEKIPILLQIPAAHRWVSIEPCLSSINIMPYLLPKLKFNPERVKSRKLGWVVLGGETGPKGRPCQEGWVISVKNQCVNAGIPFFFKQWGSWNLSHNQNRLVDGREWNEIPKFKESETS